MFSGRWREKNVNRGRKKDVSREMERWEEREKFAEGGRVRKFVGKKDCLSLRIDNIWI